jgi:hypothetical protein
LPAPQRVDHPHALFGPDADVHGVVQPGFAAVAGERVGTFARE